jgi:hypothetical protein
VKLEEIPKTVTPAFMSSTPLILGNPQSALRRTVTFASGARRVFSWLKFERWPLQRLAHTQALSRWPGKWPDCEKQPKSTRLTILVTILQASKSGPRWLVQNDRIKPDARERLARIETEARTLARSGNYRSFISIKMMLLASGYSEAHKVFANRWTQFELDRLCQQAQDCCHEGRGLGIKRHFRVRE